MLVTLDTSQLEMSPSKDDAELNIRNISATFVALVDNALALRDDHLLHGVQDDGRLLLVERREEEVLRQHRLDALALLVGLRVLRRLELLLLVPLPVRLGAHGGAHARARRLALHVLLRDLVDVVVLLLFLLLVLVDGLLALPAQNL